jgi:hypothetical protein
MGRIRINLLRAIGLMMEGGSRQITLDDEALEDLREALRAGDWEIVDRREEERVDPDRLSRKQKAGTLERKAHKGRRSGFGVGGAQGDSQEGEPEKSEGRRLPRTLRLFTRSPARSRRVRR